MISKGEVKHSAKVSLTFKVRENNRSETKISEKAKRMMKSRRNSAVFVRGRFSIVILILRVHNLVVSPYSLILTQNQ